MHVSRGWTPPPPQSSLRGIWTSGHTHISSSPVLGPHERRGDTYRMSHKQVQWAPARWTAEQGSSFIPQRVSGLSKVPQHLEVPQGKGTWRQRDGLGQGAGDLSRSR